MFSIASSEENQQYEQPVKDRIYPFMHLMRTFMTSMFELRIAITFVFFQSCFFSKTTGAVLAF